MLDSIADSFDADGFNFDNDAINRILEDDALFQSVDGPHLGASLEPEPGEQFLGDGRMGALSGVPGATEECTCKTCGKVNE